MTGPPAEFSPRTAARFQPGNRRKSVGAGSLLVLCLLLAIPALAFLRVVRSFDWRFVLGYIFLISALSCWFYYRDKKSARSGEQRIPESTLHLLEMCGGWPAAFIAQRAFRHKIRKVSYQFSFWMIVAGHEFFLFDFIQNWQYSRMVISFLRPSVA